MKNKIQCGVDKNKYKSYNFEDHIWYQNQSLRKDLLHLAQRAVKIGTNYWMKKVGSPHWICLGTITDAEKEAFNTWLGATLVSGTVVDGEMIKTFFRGTEEQGVGKKTVTVHVGSCPNLYQKMVVPMGPQFVTYNNQSYLNTWYDDMIESSEEDLPIGKLVLLMCYGGLCNGVVDKENLSSEADRIYNMIVEDKFDNAEFKFLIYWLAALRQRPGINLLTNIWLLGRLEGLGKGTLVDIMGLVLGPEFVGILNQTEIESGWNDHIVGKQLVVINEFDTDGKMTARSWRKWIKAHTIEPYFKVRQRNTTSYMVLHIGNFIILSNVEDIDLADENDRRNQFIKTTDDPWWVQFAASLQIKYWKQQPHRVAGGFAHILDQVKVNYDFISRSFKNEFRKSIVSNNHDIIQIWLSNDAAIQKDVWMKGIKLYDFFKTWHIQTHSSLPLPTLTSWGRKMGKSGHLGILKREKKEGVEYCFSDVPEIETHNLEDVSKSISSVTKEDTLIVDYDMVTSENKIPNFSDLTPMEKMRAQLKKLKD